MNKKGNGYVVATIVFVALVFGGSLVYHFWLAPHIALKQVDSAHEIVDKTYDSSNAIYNYEWFKNQYEDILAQEKQIDNTFAQVEDFKSMLGS